MRKYYLSCKEISFLWWQFGQELPGFERKVKRRRVPLLGFEAKMECAGDALCGWFGQQAVEGCENETESLPHCEKKPLCLN